MSDLPSARAFHDHLLESQYWTREQMLGEQRKYLRQLLIHARAQIPYYRGRFDRLFDNDGQIDWTLWNEVPILTRAEALAYNDDLLSRKLPRHQGGVSESFTSGSTGPALRVVDSELSKRYLTAALHRAYGWHRMDYSRDMVLWFGEDPDVGQPPDGDVTGNWGPPWDAHSTGRRIVLNRYAGTADVLKLLADERVGYFSARPAAAHAAALRALDEKIAVSLDGIFTFNTGVRPDEREDFAKAFGARAIVPYSAKEGHFIAMQCPTGTHFHINEELVFVEIVDAQGRACAEGETGRVLVTLLFNYALPLIRYELGDLATFGPPCGCGRTLRVIDRIDGRVTHMFRLPDGTRMSLSLAIDLQRSFGARYWQIAQIGPTLIEVRYVPSGALPGAESEKALADVIRQKMHPDMQVIFSPREDLSRPDGRKFIEYVYEANA